MTLKQQKVKSKLLQKLGFLRKKRDLLIKQIESLKEYKKVLRELPRRKIPIRSPDRASGPETTSAISILS